MKIKGSYILAALLALVLGGWLASGKLIVGGQSDTAEAAAQDPTSAETAPKAEEPAKLTVRVHEFSAETRVGVLTIRGRSEAEARLVIKAETAARVSVLPQEKGSAVKAGDIVCEFDTGARQARLLQAQAQLAQADLDYEAASKLQTNGFASDTRVRALKAQRDAAAAVVAEAELDLSRTKIAAPFAGVIDDQNAEIGDFLGVGDPCVTLTSRNPILIVGQVSERDIGLIKTGMTARAKLVTGQEVEGKIRFIGQSADPATRTFRVELEVPNDANTLRDGVTAQIFVPLPPVKAHKLNPTILSLDDEGQIGVRIVGDNDIVHFNPVTIVQDGTDGIWVTGLPDNVTIITVGQDYVKDGQPVTPVSDEKGQG